MNNPITSCANCGIITTKSLLYFNAPSPFRGDPPPYPRPYFFWHQKKYGKEKCRGTPWAPNLPVPLNKRRLPVLALFLIIIHCAFAYNMVQGKQSYARASPPQGIGRASRLIASPTLGITKLSASNDQRSVPLT